MLKEIFEVSSDELLYRLQVFVFTIWFMRLFLSTFRNLKNYKLSSYVLYASPFLALVLSFLIEKKPMVFGLFILLGLAIVFYLGRKIYNLIQLKMKR